MAMGGTSLPSLAAVAGLGAFHGANPGMGWLFAVALGMQEGRRQAVWRALLPLGAGHAVSVAAVLLAVRMLDVVTPPGWLALVAGAMLVMLGASRLVRHRHPRWVRMRVGLAGLTAWSALMATAHGAGLMLLPFVLSSAPAEAAGAHCHVAAAGGGPGVWAVTLVHGSSYLLTTAAIAVVVYEKVGLGMLRRAWVNVDLVWAAALVLTGLLTLWR
jgi:hypothetical protein